MINVFISRSSENRGEHIKGRRQRKLCIRDRDRFTIEESELFYLLYLYFTDIELRESVPELASNVKNVYSVIDF